MEMTSSWLPAWAEVIAVVVYAAILVLHVRHVVSAHGLGRLWHVGHIVMAIGMIDMFWPGTMPVGEVGGEIAFSTAAVLSLAVGVYAVASGQNWRVWAVSAIDFAGMVYMFAMMSHTIAPITLVLVVWSIAEALAWLSGSAFTLFKVSEHGVDMRITLAAMTVGMAYMFLAMQYGMPSMDVSHMNDMNMPGTSDSPGMSPGMSTGMSGMDDMSGMTESPSMSPSMSPGTTPGTTPGLSSGMSGMDDMSPGMSSSMSGM